MINFITALENSRQYVNEALEYYFCNLPDQQLPLIQAMRHSSLQGGKRLRPFLVYQTGLLFGVMPVNLHAAAAAIECIHAYSLIHDDLPIMDNDVLRRGLPTCHVKFGETTAILAGNALHALAFSILATAEMPEVSSHDRLQMISTLAIASGPNGMCFGQALDLSTQEQKLTATRLEMIYQYKTSVLFCAAVQMGLLVAGRRCELARRYLENFAAAIGLAFQVQDDILDVIDDNKITNKQQNINQMRNKKNTYPALLGMDAARAKVQDLYNESITFLEYVSALGYDTTILSTFARYIIERDK